MKKIIPDLFIFTVFFISISVLPSSSCNKKSDSGSKPPSSFIWTFKGTTYKADLCSAYVHYDLTPFLIMAITGTDFNTNFTQKIYFSLDSFNTGNFTIVPGPGSNILHYIDVLGNDHSGVSGTLSLISYANNLLSGNFSATIAGPSGNEPITGSFSNVPVRP
jgi:hypothetical protein